MLIISIIKVAAQQPDSLLLELRTLSELEDPVKSGEMMNNLITKYQLKKDKDAETIDRMKGSVAMHYLGTSNYREFDKKIGSMSNPYNRTHYLNMAAVTLMEKKKDLKKAESLAKRTLDLYFLLKDDPKLRPEYIPEDDWGQFIEFAEFFYCDTYAMVLDAMGKYKDALAYQEQAFNSSNGEGSTSSVERYAQLLVLNNHDDKAYRLLLSRAEQGMSNSAMDNLLKEVYLRKNNNNLQAYDSFFASVRTKFILTLKDGLKKKMQNIPAPEFTLMDVDGNAVSLSEFKGKVVVLDFWATWCGPCKASFPSMHKVMQQHPEVKFLFIATREKPEGVRERIKKYIADNKYPFHVLLDKSVPDDPQLFQVLSAYKAHGIPTKIVIDAKGIQRFFSVGFTSDYDVINQMEAMIQIANEQ